ncbi:MAG: nitronate monooxygenase [Gemmatimonadetes bacterium]|nr:nitronate monooxygenase [Gemmatimonadota bacterium]
MSRDTALTRHAGIDVPLICGAMYPCSNPELVAAASAAGALGVVQPVSLTFVHGHDFREGLRLIRRLTDRPIGMNALIEASSSAYRKRMEAWVDVALEEGVRFFVTSLGNPRWVAERAHAAGGVVYHDVTERKWALKARDAGVDGFIGVNRRAGGHPGPLDARPLLDDVGDLGLPVVCAGGIATGDAFAEVLAMGYAGVQMGTRFIATTECRASDAYKRAIVEAGEDDIVWTERISGVPVAVIDTPYVRRLGLKAGPFARWMLRGRTRTHLMRSVSTLRSRWQLRRAALIEDAVGYWQAGRTVAGNHPVEAVATLVARFRHALARTPEPSGPGTKPSRPDASS